MAKLNAPDSIVNGPSTVLILVGWGSVNSRTYPLPTHSAEVLQGPTIVQRRSLGFFHSSLSFLHSVPDTFEQAAPGVPQLSLCAFEFLPLPTHAAA